MRQMKRYLLALTATALAIGSAAMAAPAMADTPTPTPSASVTATPSATATATPAPTATPTPAPAIVLTNTTSGSASNLTAVLTGIPSGSTVTLQRAKGSRTNWVGLTSAVSDASGSVEFPGVHSNHSQLYRVTSGAVTSNVVSVQQYALSPVSLSLHVSRTGDYVRATGAASYTSVWIDNGPTFRDAISGYRVHLQRYTTKWKDADIIHSTSTGGLSDKVQYSAKTKFRFAAVAMGAYKVAASASVTK